MPEPFQNLRIPAFYQFFQIVRTQPVRFHRFAIGVGDVILHALDFTEQTDFLSGEWKFRNECIAVTARHYNHQRSTIQHITVYRPRNVLVQRTLKGALFIEWLGDTIVASAGEIGRKVA